MWRLEPQPGAGEAEKWSCLLGSSSLPWTPSPPPFPPTHSSGRPGVAWDKILASKLGGDQGTDPAAVPKPTSHFLEARTSSKVRILPPFWWLVTSFCLMAIWKRKASLKLSHQQKGIFTPHFPLVPEGSWTTWETTAQEVSIMLRQYSL